MLLPPRLLLLPLLWAGALTQNQGFRLRLEQQVTVEEGQCVLVSCEMTYPRIRYTHGYWFRRTSLGTPSALVATNNPAQQVQKETRGRFHLLGDPQDHSCSLDIRDARREDTGTYYFRVERGPYVANDYTNHPLNVTVTALTQTPHVQLLGTLQSGHPSTITCSAPWACPRGMPPTFSWTGVALPSRGTDSPVLSLTPGPQHHGTSLTCRVSFPGAGVSTERTVRLSVDYAPWNLAIRVIRKEGSGPAALGNGSALLVQEGQSLRLVCVVDSHPPANLSWVRGSLTVKSSASLSPVGAGGVGEHSQSLELELPSVHLNDHGTFLCRAQHPLGSQEASLILSVQSPPQLLDLTCSWKDEGLHCSCACSVRPAPSLSWRLGEQLLEGNSSNASFQVTFSHGGSWANSSLGFHTVFNSDLSLSCEALNAHGKWGTSILLPPILRSPNRTQDPTFWGPLGNWTGVILGAAGAVVITVLFTFCLVFLIVRSSRGKQVEAAASKASLGTTERAREEYVNGSWAVSPSDSSGANVPLREEGAALLPPQVPQGIAPDVQDKENTVKAFYSVITF